MTLCLLVRHAAHDLLGKVLVGRSPGVTLSESGRRKAHGLGRTLQALGISKVQSSPRLRAVETASSIAAHNGLDMEIRAELDEIDFGTWSGRSFAELADDPQWMRWNGARSQARPPVGESMAEAQERVVSHLSRTCANEPQACIAMITHAEIIRAAALHCMALPLDAWEQVDFAPAAVVHFQWRGHDARPLVQLNGGMAAA